MVQNLWLAAGYNMFALAAAAGVLAAVGTILSRRLACCWSISTIVVAINAQLMRSAKI